jgi:hypothetical protein
MIDLRGGPQALFVALGAALVALPWLPAVRRYLAITA